MWQKLKLPDDWELPSFTDLAVLAVVAFCILGTWKLIELLIQLWQYVFYP